MVGVTSPDTWITLRDSITELSAGLSAAFILLGIAPGWDPKFGAIRTSVISLAIVVAFLPHRLEVALIVGVIVGAVHHSRCRFRSVPLNVAGLIGGLILGACAIVVVRVWLEFADPAIRASRHRPYLASTLASP